MAMRSEYKDAFEVEHDIKLGFMSAFICASASGLVKFPDVNAVIEGVRTKPSSLLPARTHNHDSRDISDDRMLVRCCNHRLTSSTRITLISLSRSPPRRAWSSR